MDKTTWRAGGVCWKPEACPEVSQWGFRVCLLDSLQGCLRQEHVQHVSAHKTVVCTCVQLCVDPPKTVRAEPCPAACPEALEAEKLRPFRPQRVPPGRRPQSGPRGRPTHAFLSQVSVKMPPPKLPKHPFLRLTNGNLCFIHNNISIVSSDSYLLNFPRQPQGALEKLERRTEGERPTGCREGRVSRIVTTRSPQSLTVTPAAPWLAPPVAMALLLRG